MNEWSLTACINQAYIFSHTFMNAMTSSNKSLSSEYLSLGNKGLWWPLKQAAINQEKLFTEWGESGFKHDLSFWPLRHSWGSWGSGCPLRELQAELSPLSSNAGRAFSGMLPSWRTRAGTPLTSSPEPQAPSAWPPAQSCTAVWGSSRKPLFFPPLFF